MRELSKEEIIERGRRAAALLEDPIITEALADITRQAIDEFETAGPHEVEKLQRARHLLDATQRFARVFVEHIQRGHAIVAREESDLREII